MGGTNSTRAHIRHFIVSQFPLALHLNLADEDSLLESGVIDSMGVLQLLTFIVETFNIYTFKSEISIIIFYI